MNTDPYRRAAAALHQAQRDRGAKTVIVASAADAEGKSRTTAHLALTLAQNYGRRVLLVDGDLRRPALHTLFGAANRRGVADVLSGTGPIVDLSTVSVGETLELLPAGRPIAQPLALVTSSRMGDLLAFGATQFDWVIVDTPPVLLLPDSQLLASMVDAVMLVVSAGETDYRLAARAADALGRNRILGVVLNKVEPSELPAYAAYEYGSVR